MERVSNFKYLGVFIDEYFTFKTHYEHILKRVCASVGLINGNRRMLTPQMLMFLLNAYVNSVTDYCLVVWDPSRILDFKFIQNKINELLVAYFYPKMSKFYTKRFWKAHDGNVMAVKDCRTSHSKIDYYYLLERCNQLTLSERLKFFSAWNVYKNIRLTP